MVAFGCGAQTAHEEITSERTLTVGCGYRLTPEHNSRGHRRPSRAKAVRAGDFSLPRSQIFVFVFASASVSFAFSWPLQMCRIPPDQNRTPS